MQSLPIRWRLGLWLGFSVALGFVIWWIGFTLISTKSWIIDGLPHTLKDIMAGYLLVIFPIFLIGFLLGACLYQWILKWINRNKFHCFWMGVFIGLIISLAIIFVIDLSLAVLTVATCNHSFEGCFGGPIEQIFLFFFSLIIGFLLGGWMAVICGVLFTFGVRRFLMHSLTEKPEK
jgi:hypothetical protein